MNMRTLLTLLALLACWPSHAAEITNFRAGLACTANSPRDDAEGWICQPTEEILVTDQGTCIYNGQEMRCTWVGFEFDYRGANDGDELQCVVESSAPMNRGNPNEELSEDSSSGSFSIPLKPGTHHLFNPQYFVFAARPAAQNLLVDKGRCMHNGKLAFEYTYRVSFPVLPQP